MARRRLPIGMQTFREVRGRDCYYVDKTAYIQRLLDEGKHYFLSRPRRFGKSLFLDTLKEVLEGNEALFSPFAATPTPIWTTSLRMSCRASTGSRSASGTTATVGSGPRRALGLDVTVEDSGSRGRLDMAVRFNGNVYLFEFKVLEHAGEGAAMAQLKERRYADKYRGLGQPIHLIAVEFSSETRNLAAFEVERA